MFKNKIKAALAHFIISLFVFSIFIAILYYFWFPEPYFSATGGWQGLQIIALVDLILGPLLTFIIFNTSKQKKELFIDLGVIITFQFTALIWGINTISQQRPVAISFFEDSFFTVPISEVKSAYPNSAMADKLIKHPRQLFYIEKPKNLEGIKAMYQKAMDNNLPPPFHIEHFKDYKKNFDDMRQHNLNIQEIININEQMKIQVEEILAKSNTKLNDNIYLKLHSKYQNIVLIFDVKGKQIGYAKAPYFK